MGAFRTTVLSPSKPQKKATQRCPRRIVLAEIVLVEDGVIGVVLAIAVPVRPAVPMPWLEESGPAALDHLRDAEAHPAAEHVNDA